jgi:hypothetical protein
MKPHHAAALALVGWYLMSPSLTDDGLGVISSAPLSQWEILASFDAARDCEREKESRQNKAVYVLRMLSSQKLLKSHHAPLNYIQDANGVCVSTDDPRLEAKIRP